MHSTAGNLRFVRSALGLCVLAIAACGGAETVVGIDWEDSNAVVEPMEGWTANSCEGEAPFVCVSGPSGEAGLVEVIRLPNGSIPLDPDSPEASLRQLASDFVASIGADRLQGCGADYVVEAIEPESAPVAGESGLRFGFVGRMGDGSISERNIQHARVEGEEVILVTAAAYADGGCPGRDELDSFDPAGLEAFDEGLSALVADLPLP